ncbi:hypothetical protein Slin15195_G119500 [Septoria linicola]|uniref:Uncharacterized protein n=1 Tax=Septoria linicola TaxID=215465 RepID=A0A9Q9B946_9PEZI|nr:hypothetical protein Slin14017_G096490 [Septoria linicola]USW58631.1 hypothetical protein Slin15195_G119500 [Septoria linicola]
MSGALQSISGLPESTWNATYTGEESEEDSDGTQSGNLESDQHGELSDVEEDGVLSQTANGDEDDEDSCSEDEEIDYEYGFEAEDDQLITTAPIGPGLLLVNWRVSAEALPFFYRPTTFILDGDGASCMRFIRELSPVVGPYITSVVITNAALMGDDGPSRRAWSGSTETPLYRGADGLALITPFGKLLAKKLPSLREIIHT